MQTLPFQRKIEIEQSLTQVEIQDLVLVLSQATSDKLLLVYNTDQPPTIENVDWQVESLRDLTSSLDFATYNGLIIGWPAIDVMLPDVPTHGVNFYSIQHIFHHQGKTEQLRETSYRLANTLLDYLDIPHVNGDQLRYRGYAKVIQLALPALLSGQTLQNLIAVLPSANLREFLNRESPGMRLIYNDLSQENDLSWMGRYEPNRDNQWIIALEEIELFCPGVSRGYRLFIELRQVLRGTEAERALNETCRGLARRCWQTWLAFYDNRFLTTAYSLAAEACLAEEDAEELVALLPNNDLERFLAGDALRVYRWPVPSPSITPSSRSRCSLEYLINSQVPEKYMAPSLSFPILGGALQRVNANEAMDLGPVLWKVGERLSWHMQLICSRGIF